MPSANRFRHQTYTAAEPTAPFHLIQPGKFPPIGSDEHTRRMRQAGERFRAAGVSAIYLVHGTFAGSDALGFFGEIQRLVPALGESWQRAAKQLVDAVLGNVGNYTRAFAERMEQSLSSPEERMPVRRFTWSSENHHVGRADAAVRLIDEMLEHEPRDRVLLWGHSHAGNVFALMSNLLSGDRVTVDRFFDATRVYARRWFSWRRELPHFRRVRERLTKEPAALPPLDFVTFGTPIRYGWDAAGYGRLLHFVHHRAVEGLPPHRAAFPPSQRDVGTARHGDYIQQLGIAGTNFMPNLLFPRDLLADLRLASLLQGRLRKRDLLARLRLGMRVAEQGATLLTDYGPPRGSIAQHMAGHAVYTAPEWMLFHCEETARRLYTPSPDEKDR